MNQSRPSTLRDTITVVSPDIFTGMISEHANECETVRLPTEDRRAHPGNAQPFHQRHIPRHSRSKSASALSCQDEKTAIVRPYTSAEFSRGVGEWLSEKQIQNVQEKTAYGSTAVKNICASLLENENKLIEATESYLVDNHRLQFRKKYLLTKRWHENVYYPLKARVEQEMEGCHFKAFEKEKRNLYKEYLMYLNRKGDVFLDIMSKNEYDPLQLVRERPGPLRAVTGHLDDPLLYQGSKRTDEKRVLLAYDSGIPPTDDQVEQEGLPSLPLIPLGRQGTECHSWLSMELRDIQSRTRSRSQKRVWGVRNSSSIPMDNWTGKNTVSTLEPLEGISRRRRPFSEKHATTLVLV